MFDLVHAMRTRVMTSPAFAGLRVLAAIFVLSRPWTATSTRASPPRARYLWDEKAVVLFLSIHGGLASSRTASSS